MSFADYVFPFADLASYWWIPLLAVALDAAIGDPPGWPHPVRLIGALCNAVEPRARRMIRPERLAGACAVLCVLGGAWIVVRLVLLFPFFVSAILAVYLCFAGLALGQLLREGNRVLGFLERGDIENARTAVSMLVSRDVSQADEATLCRSLAETLAENVNDAFIAPLFWLVAGGPVALWLYKAASTMDSMWGYPHEPWTRFGTAGARLDDVLAYAPARLTVLFLYLAAHIRARIPGPAHPEKTESAPWPGFARIARDARQMKSPNAGWPMAACAWIHGASMGGPTVYAGKIVEKPVLGPAGILWTTEKLKALCDNLRLAGICGAATLLAAGWGFHSFL